MITDWDDAYANRDHVPGAAAFIERWPLDAAHYRQELAAAGRLQEGVAYGKDERERYDLLLPSGRPQGLVVFVHGGYWQAFSRSDWTHYGRGAVDSGWAVAVPSYTLCPPGRIGRIVAQVGAAIEHAARGVAGPIRLTGHSAGGQLVARMVSQPSPLSPATLARVARVVAISGVHDLRPLMRTRMNQNLQLDATEAQAHSPALLTPVDGTDIVCWVGGDERPEFLRQNALLASLWLGCGARTRVEVDVQKHHFNVIDGLGRADGALTRCLLA